MSATAPLPPTPLHLLRSHSSPITTLAWSDDNERIYSADSSGKVVVTSTRSLRTITAWNAHTDSILGVEEWDTYIVTHSRDHKIHVWHRVEELPFSDRIGGSAGVPDTQTPKILYSLDVNALNFCRFSLLRLPPGPDDQPRALIAIPNLVDSTTVDVWSLPSIDRVHAAIGQEIQKSIFSENPGGRNNSGIVMSIHLYRHQSQSPSEASSSYSTPRNLRVLATYENGSVVLREYDRSAKEASVEGQGWDIIWKSKLHVESIMAMRVSPTNAFALTVSADHIIGRYDLMVDAQSSEEHGVAHRTKHPGNGSLAIRDDGKVCAVGGWDGKIRLYSTKSLKPLGTLKYHKLGCQSVEFAHAIRCSIPDVKPMYSSGIEADDDDDMTDEEKQDRARWLVVGSKDNRVSIWSLISFAK